MPEYASKIKIQATRSYGAEVVLSPTRDESDTKVLNESKIKMSIGYPLLTTSK